MDSPKGPMIWWEMVGSGMVWYGMVWWELVGSSAGQGNAKSCNKSSTHFLVFSQIGIQPIEFLEPFKHRIQQGSKKVTTKPTNVQQEGKMSIWFDLIPFEKSHVTMHQTI